MYSCVDCLWCFAFLFGGFYFLVSSALEVFFVVPAFTEKTELDQ